MKKRLSILVACVAGSLIVGAAPALAGDQQGGNGSYLALGDSVPFG